MRREWRERRGERGEEREVRREERGEEREEREVRRKHCWLQPSHISGSLTVLVDQRVCSV